MNWSTLPCEVILLIARTETVADARSAFVKNLRLVNKHWYDAATKSLTQLNPQTLEQEDFPRFITRMQESFVNVARLQIPSVWIDDTCCEAFGSLSHLSELEIFWGDSITDDGLLKLTSASNLHTLKVYHSRQITDEGVKALAKLNLKVLWLYGATEVTDNGLNSLSTLTSLKAVRLMYCNRLTRRGLEPLVNRGGLQLFVRYCRRISTEIMIS